MQFLYGDVLSVELLSRLRDVESNCIDPLIITSAWRSGPDNAAVDGLPNSLHLLGRAVDIRTRDRDVHTLVQCARLAGFSPHEIVVEEDHLHLELELPHHG